MFRNIVFTSLRSFFDSSIFDNRCGISELLDRLYRLLASRFGGVGFAYAYERAVFRIEFVTEASRFVLVNFEYTVSAVLFERVDTCELGLSFVRFALEHELSVVRFETELIRANGAVR